MSNSGIIHHESGMTTRLKNWCHASRKVDSLVRISHFIH